MKKSKLLMAVLLSGLFFSEQLCVYAGPLTDAKQLDKGLKLGLDYATAVAKKGDLAEGSKAALEKTFTDEWTWNYVVGNYEKLITGADKASIPDMRKKMQRIKAVIDGVDKASTALGAGNYDEALIASLDGLVGGLNHPVINATWAAIKLTMMSQKELNDTKAALQIEALYGALENDRILRGTRSGDGPKVFEMKAETVDYFFNKYLITNDSTREMMKAYVKVKLNEDFPEMDTWESFTDIVNIGNSTDAQKAKEIEELSKYKNQGRHWIAELLKDMNKQAKLRWAETRAEQEKAAFQKYVEQYGYFEKNFDRLAKEFEEMQRFAQEAKTFPQFVADSQKKRQVLEATLNSLTPSKIKEKTAIFNTAEEWELKCINYSSKASIIGQTSLAESIKTEWKAWSAFKEKVKIKFEEPIATVLSDTESEILKGSGDSSTKSAGDAYYQSRILPLLKPFEWKADIESVKQEYLDALNRGEWEKLTSIEMKLDGCTTNYCDERGDFGRHYEEILKQMNKVFAENPTTSVDEGDDGNGHKYVKCTSGNYGCSVDLAHTIAMQAFDNMYNAQKAEYISVVKWMNDTRQVYEELMAARDKQYQEIGAAIARYSLALPSKPPGNIEKWDPVEYYGTNTDIENWMKDPFSGLGKMPESQDLQLKDVASFLAYQSKLHNDWAAYKVQRLDDYSQGVDALIPVWQKGAADWKEYVDSLEMKQEDFDEITVLVDPNFTKESLDSVSELAASVGRCISAIRTNQQKYKTFIDTETTNHYYASDYLMSLSKEWGKWYNGHKGLNGTVWTNFGNLLYVPEPFPHFATKQEYDDSTKDFKQELTQLNTYKFAQKHMPIAFAKMNALTSAPSFNPAKEENFIHPLTNEPVWKSELDSAQSLVAQIKPEDIDFIDKLDKVKNQLPGTLRLPTPTQQAYEAEVARVMGKPKPKPANEYTGELYPVDESKLNFPLGQKYLEIRNKIKTLMNERMEFIKKLQSTPPVDPKDNSLDTLRGQINDYLKLIQESNIKTDDMTLSYCYSQLDTYKTAYLNIGKKRQDLDKALADLEGYIKSLSEQESANHTALVAKVKDFYTQFKQAYESRNDSVIMGLISSDWNAGDGTTLDELETTFRRTFNIFDSISFNISNLTITPAGNNAFNVTYDLLIVGDSYERGLHHEEKSTVSEVLRIENNKVRILRTINGRFWYIN